MSNAVSALQGEAYAGFATITEQGLRGMITLRGDLASAPLKKAVKALTGLGVPSTRGCVLSDSHGVAWMSPDELLILCPYAKAEAGVAELSKALAGQHFLAANMSDARAVFAISGEGARDVIAKLAPVDMALDAFTAGEIRRTRLAQAPAAFWLRDAETIEVMCFRSQAEYVFELLKRAAQPGTETGLF
jgi:sarcosine oxidase subunit gamma